jgi:serine/threonine protein kinase/tetratricopeptide (TPR) repeat protein
MDGIPAPIRLQKQLGACPQCGSAWRIKRGLCVSCLLAQGLITEGSNGESLEEVLSEIELRDNEWRVGDYQILQEIGSGGIGVVYRARHQRSRRVVALKQILPYHADSQRTVSRFWHETEAATTLDHPYILPIYDVGDSLDGLPFFTMKFAIGGSLLEKASSLRKDPRRAVALMAKVARAVQYAHDRRILHGDLKPSNILLDGQGEPMVSDFGLAKWLDSTRDRNPTLTVFGTAGYIAPEQAMPAPAGAANLTPAADVYSLGAILFDLFTGRPPFLGEHALAAIRQASERPAPKLRSLAPSLDRDLETICAKCLERDPAARYQSPAELAEDLERWLDHRPIIARPLSPPARAWYWARRNPSTAAIAALMLALATAVGIMSWKNKPAVAVPEANSIAVLPFDGLSEDRGDQFFADGVQDDILTKLAKIRGLKVINRSSVMEYRPVPGGRNLRQIGAALGVSHVLEGDARKIGARFELNVRLSNARTGALLWSQQYTRKLDDMFAAQAEIALKVADELHVPLSNAERLSIQQPPTVDSAAYDLYTRAQSLLTERLSGSMKSNLLQAVDLLNQAVARDPKFHQAYCQLAYAHDQLYFQGYDHTPERRAAAEAAVERALRLRPDAGETRLAHAQNLYNGYLDYEGALAQLETARQTLANQTRVMQLMGYIQRRQGRWEEAIQSLERARELDPRNVETLQEIALTCGVLGRWAQSKTALQEALAIDPNDIDTRVALAVLEFHRKADLRPIRRTIQSLEATNPGALVNVADEWLNWALAERDAAAAQKILNTIGDTPLSDYSVHLTRPLIEGVIARMTHNEAKARAAFTAARAEQEKAVQAQSDYATPLCVLGLIDAGLGRKEEALREGRRALELLSPNKDALVGPAMAKYLAMIAAWVGDKDFACQQLAVAVRPPTAISYGQLKLLPFWDPLRGDPRFEKILASLAPQESLKR